MHKYNPKSFCKSIISIMDIKTFVFLDSETTGLPSAENNRTKITELCLSAVQTEHLMLGVNPRVQNKITICINPRKMIHPCASEITGLYNDMLEHQSEFTYETANLIKQFLELFRKPICFVAHNGNLFDYPILRTHFNQVDNELSDDVLCIDSLVAFRAIYDQESQQETQNIGISGIEPLYPKQEVKLSKNQEPRSDRNKELCPIDNQEVCTFDNQGINPSINQGETRNEYQGIYPNLNRGIICIENQEVRLSQDSNPKKFSFRKTGTTKYESPFIDHNYLCHSNYGKEEKISETQTENQVPILENIANDQFQIDSMLNLESQGDYSVLNPCVFKQQMDLMKSKAKKSLHKTVQNEAPFEFSDGFDEMLYKVVEELESSDSNEQLRDKELKRVENIQKINETTPEKKGLNKNMPGVRNVTKGIGAGGSNGVRKKLFKPSFKLSNVYQRLTKKEPIDAHQAEVDVSMLISCATALGEKFIEWANSNAKKFNDIPMMVPGKKI